MVKRRKYTYDWPRPTVSADAVVFTLSRNKAKLLLVNRRYEPFKSQWALPGGFVGIDEELEDAVARELEEETGMVDVRLEQIHAFGKCGRDPRARQITIAFMGIATKGQNKIRAGDDAAKVRWFDIERLPKDMGFDHKEIAEFAIKKLKRKRIYQLNIKTK